MTIDLKLDAMTLTEKLTAMELLWADISAKPVALTSPSWHESVLNHRRQQSAAGILQFKDWKSAITKLKEELNANPSAGKRRS
jgi:hypothetical protein